jgi:hypothetical protein
MEPARSMIGPGQHRQHYLLPNHHLPHPSTAVTLRTCPLRPPAPPLPTESLCCTVHSSLARPPPLESQDELISAELVLSGALEALSPAEAVALVSALVFQVSE